MTDFLQNADLQTFLVQLALRAQTAHQVCCDFVKNPMKFYRLSFRGFLLFIYIPIVYDL